MRNAMVLLVLAIGALAGAQQTPEPVEQTTTKEGTPICAKRCVLGAPTSQKNSCDNFTCGTNADGSLCFTLAKQTVDGEPCAWTYPPMLPMPKDGDK